MTRTAQTIALLLGLAAAGAVLAQGTTTSVNLPQSQDGQQESPGPTAPVGAGTSDAVTTGVSGPEAANSGGPTKVPPVPGADLCRDYEGQPAHAFCLATVTSERSVQ